MPGRKRKPAAQRDAEGNPGHRPILPDADFTSGGVIGAPPVGLMTKQRPSLSVGWLRKGHDQLLSDRIALHLRGFALRVQHVC
jgi:hypothetical protein